MLFFKGIICVRTGSISAIFVGYNFSASQKRVQLFLATIFCIQ